MQINHGVLLILKEKPPEGSDIRFLQNQTLGDTFIFFRSKMRTKFVFNDVMLELFTHKYYSSDLICYIVDFFFSKGSTFVQFMWRVTEPTGITSRLKDLAQGCDYELRVDIN